MVNTYQRQIKELQGKHHAVILAHNYQNPEIQDIADFVGDSLDLSLKATKTDAKTIVFCGVDFMAESAKILNPEKTVILPDRTANCPMAEMVDVASLTRLMKEHPDADVVAYINTTAEVKTLADICCTSANGVKIVKSRNAKKIIFVPDRNLGLFIQKQVPEKEMILWPGVCSTHHRITKQDCKKRTSQCGNPCPPRVPAGGYRYCELCVIDQWHGFPCEDIAGERVHHWDGKRSLLPFGEGKPGEDVLFHFLGHLPEYEKNHGRKSIKKLRDVRAEDRAL
jgi:hypothetical protein